MSRVKRLMIIVLVLSLLGELVLLF